MATSWTRSPGNVYAWCKTERPTPILSTTDAQGNWFLNPNGVARRRPSSGEGSGGPCPLARSPRPSRLMICPGCSPSRGRSSGMYSDTFPEPKPRAWMLGHQTTSKPCPGRLAMPGGSPRPGRGRREIASSALGRYCGPIAQKGGPRAAGPKAHQPSPNGLQAVGSGTRGHPEGVVH